MDPVVVRGGRPLAEVPALELNNMLMRQTTLEVLPPSAAKSEPNPPAKPNGSLRDVPRHIHLGLGDYLRSRLLPHDERSIDGFLTAELVAEYVRAEDVERELARHPSLEGRVTSAEIQASYLIVFSLLCIVERGIAITHFIDAGITDSTLPLRRRPRESNYDISWILERPVATQSSSLGVIGTSSTLTRAAQIRHTLVDLQGFNTWSTLEREMFIQWQWRLTVPFLGLDKDDVALHRDFAPEVILPLSPIGIIPTASNQNYQMLSGHGGYGSVKAVRIQSRCHGFHQLLQKLKLRNELFALKVLKQTDFNDEKQFSNELDQLKRFNGLVHEHLVTMLASFTQHGKYHFLFPLAECDLSGYFSRFRKGPQKSAQTFRWFAAQICGLMGALNAIHNPKHIPEKYGRHGDLKPDNILWYRSTGDPSATGSSSKTPFGILVISDMGISAVHRQGSRSNVPNQKIPRTPGYRPPECDIQDGTISRAYDIWTMGCVFMEMCVWLLQGSEWVDKFEQDRLADTYLTGVGSNIFFSILRVDGRETSHVIKVKAAVTRVFDEMRAHPACSQFLLDILEIIENKMIVVISEDRQRSPAADLGRELDAIRDKCMSSKAYCEKAVPVPMPRTPRETVAVEAVLNVTAEGLIEKRQPQLGMHHGKSVSAAPPDPRRNLD